MTIVDTLPESVQFVTASDRGIYQPVTRTVQWLIEDLAPEETRTVAVRVQGKTPVSSPRVSARARDIAGHARAIRGAG